MRITGWHLLLLVTGVVVISALWFGGKQSPVLMGEHGVIEILTAVFYAVAIGFCVAAFKRRRFVSVSILWGLLCFVFLGEETSWLQSYLKYSVPAVERVNDQQEFNLHNLSALRGDRFLGDESTFQLTWRTLANPQTIYLAGLVGYFLVLPLVFRLAAFTRLREALNVPLPGGGFMVVMWGVIGWSIALAFFSDQATRDVLAESREMLYAFFIALYTMGFVSKEWLSVVEGNAVSNGRVVTV